MNIVILGAHEANYPWAFELKVAKAFRELGHKVRLIDYRMSRPDMRNETSTNEITSWIYWLRKELWKYGEPDFILICRGELVPSATMFVNHETPWAVWCCESLEDPNIGGFNTSWTQQHQDNGATIFTHQPTDKLKESPHILSCACVDPDWVIKHTTDKPPKTIDVLFNGTMTTYRKDWLIAIEKELLKDIRITRSNAFGNEMAQEIMAAKIVLNIHLGPNLNTETRVAEVMGLGSYLLTQPLSLDYMFGGVGEFMDVFSAPGDAAYIIKEALADNAEREEIAKLGQEFILANHTFKTRCQEMLDVIFS